MFQDVGYLRMFVQVCSTCIFQVCATVLLIVPDMHAACMRDNERALREGTAPKKAV